MRRNPTRQFRVTYVVAFLGAIAFAPLGSASADCANPYLFVGDGEDRPVLTTDSPVTIEGRAFVDGCNDTGTSSALSGCSPSKDPEKEEPLKGRRALGAPGSTDVGARH